MVDDDWQNRTANELIKLETERGRTDLMGNRPYQRSALMVWIVLDVAEFGEAYGPFDSEQDAKAWTKGKDPAFDFRVKPVYPADSTIDPARVCSACFYIEGSGNYHKPGFEQWCNRSQGKKAHRYE